MKIRLNSKYVLAFLLLTMLSGLSHEMVHHVTGAAICGCWGYKTFNSFVLCNSCDNNPYSFWATVAGPAFTFGLMWFGWYQLRKPGNKNKQLGFALIFANFPINRIMFAFMGYNDEQWVAQQLYGDSQIAFWGTIILILICTLPPLTAAYQQIKNRQRWLWFLGFFILPFVFVILFAGLFLEEYLLLKMQFLNEPILGIPYLLILVEMLCAIGYAFTKKYLYASPETALSEAQPKTVSIG